MRNSPEPLARCSRDGAPLVLVTYGGARFGSGVIMLGCPRCERAVEYRETAPPSDALEPAWSPAYDAEELDA
jgi:hypothetical protein